MSVEEGATEAAENNELPIRVMVRNVSLSSLSAPSSDTIPTSTELGNGEGETVGACTLGTLPPPFVVKLNVRLVPAPKLQD